MVQAPPKKTCCVFNDFLFFATSFTKNHDPANWALCCWAPGSLLFPFLLSFSYTGIEKMGASKSTPFQHFGLVTPSKPKEY